MNTVTNVTGVSVPVHNQEDGVAFFIDKLGFEIRRDAHMSDRSGGSPWPPPGAAVEVAIQHDPDRAGQETGIRFATHNAQAEHERLVQQGVTVHELLRWPGVPSRFKFNDPDGNIYTMIEAS